MRLQERFSHGNLSMPPLMRGSGALPDLASWRSTCKGMGEAGVHRGSRQGDAHCDDVQVSHDLQPPRPTTSGAAGHEDGRAYGAAPAGAPLRAAPSGCGGRATHPHPADPALRPSKLLRQDAAAGAPGGAARWGPQHGGTQHRRSPLQRTPRSDFSVIAAVIGAFVAALQERQRPRGAHVRAVATQAAPPSADPSAPHQVCCNAALRSA